MMMQIHYEEMAVFLSKCHLGGKRMTEREQADEEVTLGLTQSSSKD